MHSKSQDINMIKRHFFIKCWPHLYEICNICIFCDQLSADLYYSI